MNVIVMSSSGGIREATKRALSPLQADVAEAQTIGDVMSVLRVDDVDLIIADTADSEASLELLDLLDDEGAETHVLLLARKQSNMDEVINKGRALNFLAVGQDETIDAVDLNVTTRQILRGGRVPLDDYLRSENEMEFVVASTTQIEEIVARVEEAAADARCNRQICRNLGTVADELLSNALYNAPVKDGVRIYTDLPRTESVTLPLEQAAILKLRFDGRRLGMSVTDRFGSLEQKVVAKQLAKAYTKDTDQVNFSERGGSGLGLFFVLNMVNHFIISIDKNTSTEAIVLVEASRSYRAFSQRTKSFNLFVAG